MNATNGRRRLLLGGLGAAALSQWPTVALGHDAAWPDRPIKLVVPTATGGVGDAIGREFARGLSEQLGQQVIVENKPGANTSIASAFVANSAPDGYTLLLAMTSLIQNPIHYRNVGYDPLRDFTPLARLGMTATVLVVRSDKKVRNVDEFIRAARGKRWNYGFSATGPQVVMEIFNQHNDLGMTGIPYKGEVPALTDLLGGQIEVGLFSAFAVKGSLQSGQLTALAVLADRRATSLPDVPTFVEQGHGEVSYTGGWYAFMAPARVPREISGRLSQALRVVFEQPAERRRLEQMDLILNWTDGPAFAPVMKRDMDIWRELVLRSKVAIEQ
ncbi:tripartite tricarboxylate transporter substrate binding protein [Cupriavidus sp. BIS7]|uniref:tripartite tricarboxylate transporter substrate binding protein n=1 Tax=Cupriavidus sp. BIS7 TaxID=1217718 RepID=UPI001ED9522C|nr:tripartite tricarboxylate transporter substrate binding protein [Cupriavidus sp. BIS7]